MTFLEAVAQTHPAFWVLVVGGLISCFACGAITMLPWTPGRSKAGGVLLVIGIAALLAGIPFGIVSA